MNTLFDDTLVGNYVPPSLADIPPIGRMMELAVDLETSDPMIKELGPGELRKGFICGVALAWKGGSTYLPLRHGSGNMDYESVHKYLVEQLNDFKGTLIGANLSYDLGFLWANKIKTPNAKYYDIQTAQVLIDERDKSYSLDTIAKKYGLSGKSDAELEMYSKLAGFNSKSNMDKLPAAIVTPYAKVDAELTLAIYELQQPQIESLGLRKVVDLECKLLPVLMHMTHRGVAIDFAKLYDIKAKATGMVRDYCRELGNIAGGKWDQDSLRSSAFLAPKIKAVTGVDAPETDKTEKPSVNKELLASIKHPFTEALLRARKWRKLLDTFIPSIESHAIDGRLHPRYHATRSSAHHYNLEQGVAFGRLSCTHPNIQQQPIRDTEFGKDWRSIFVSDSGGDFIAADYSAQEPRMLVHIASSLTLPGAREFASKWLYMPDMDMHAEVAKICNIPRSHAKTINLGLTYGMGGGKLAQSLGLPSFPETFITNEGYERSYMKAGPEAQAILDNYDKRFPFVREAFQYFRERAKRDGIVKTIFGRTFHIAERDCYAALNRVIQGSAADQTKQAMVDADAAGLKLQLSVHDEICMTGDGYAAVSLAECMKFAVALAVPSMVDVSCGNNWGYKE